MNKTEQVDGTLEWLGNKMYARTSYGTFPLAYGLIKPEMVRELIETEVKVTILNGIVTSYEFATE